MVDVMALVNVSLSVVNTTTGIAHSSFYSTTTTAGTPSVTPGNTSDSATTKVAVVTTTSPQTAAVTTTTTQIPQNFSSNITQATLSNSSESVCLNILYEDVGSSRVRIWDVVLFVPSVLFLIFLLYNFYKSRSRVTRGLSGATPIFSVYFSLVTMAAFLSVIRCIVSMTVDVSTTAGSDANKILWVVLRFSLLMAEMSVLVFGLACGHLDSRSSIRRVLLITSLLALVYSVTQGVLEVTVEHPAYEVENDTWSVYGHGGPMFTFVTSVLFCMVYILVDILPFWECMNKYFTIPTKRTFYMYATIMAFVYFFFALGSGLLNAYNPAGLCIVDLASLLYFILFAPLLYWTFLHSYLGSVQQNSIPFSYSNQIDEVLEDGNTQSGHSAHTDADFNGILVFDRLPLTNYDGEKQGASEPLHNTNEMASDKPDDNSNANFFKEIDLADTDEFDYR